MADDRDEKTETDAEQSGTQQELGASAVPTVAAESELTAGELGVERYVHAAFFGATVLVGFLSGKVLLSTWNSLADWSKAAELVPGLLSYDEDKRNLVSVILGAIIALVAVFYTYRKEGVRRWANEVAAELARVTWPTKEAVQNGMVVVLIAGAVFTAYIGILDRIWGFLTTLVYGA